MLKFIQTHLLAGAKRSLLCQILKMLHFLTKLVRLVLWSVFGFCSMLAKQRKNRSVHLLATSQVGQVGMGANQLVS